MKQVIYTRLDPDDVVKLDALAKKEGRERSGMIRWIVRRFLSNAKK